MAAAEAKARRLSCVAMLLFIKISVAANGLGYSY
jgi:hypothetical protein